MVVLRKDTAKRKLRVKKHVFSLKDHPTRKILKIVPIGVHKEDMEKKLKLKKTYRKNILT